MVGWLKKYYAECPRCGSPQVRVPWEAGRTRWRRSLVRGLVLLWATMAGWIAFGVAIGSIWPWLGALLLYLAASGAVIWAINRSLVSFRCVECDHRWRG